ncbi:hypothetical protein QJS10_CPB14g01577 [Acorus calamus]|uniref:Factor of DNA methylation 1-5/IDN2 domain-containing protein n=1 Tax=Acorus calamus TaxID=4465 RepID=A0AAV9DC62_ACOCL|nr:hypothetical protein QJS10_CPB14g01577 [Acorus calamus]
MRRNYNRDMQKMLRLTRYNTQRFTEENQRLKMDLDTHRKELEMRHKQLDEQEARVEAERKILDDEKKKGLPKILNTGTSIGIKRMGELDEKPFQMACKRKYATVEAYVMAAELCSVWQEEIQKPHWHPFKIVAVDGQTQKERGLEWGVLRPLDGPPIRDERLRCCRCPTTSARYLRRPISAPPPR